jgi:hypothetical protein
MTNEEDRSISFCSLVGKPGTKLWVVGEGAAKGLLLIYLV